MRSPLPLGEPYVVGKGVNLDLDGGAIFLHLSQVCDDLLALPAERDPE